MNNEQNEIINENISNLNNNEQLLIKDDKKQMNKEKDLAFNRLRYLQSLLKKEAALKELFIKTSNETVKTIEDQCRDIYKKKLDVKLGEK